MYRTTTPPPSNRQNAIKHGKIFPSAPKKVDNEIVYYWCSSKTNAPVDVVVNTQSVEQIDSGKPVNNIRGTN
jgi:hypothetical protein